MQVRGIEKGGGLRRIVYKEYTVSELLEEAKKIFFPGGKSGYGKARELELCECSLGSFTGTPLELNDSNFSISRYLADNGLFASRVRFYLLTTARNKDTLDSGSSSSESLEQLRQTLSSSNENSSGASGGVRSATDIGTIEQRASESFLYIDDCKKSFVVEFCRHKMSHYTSEVSSLCVIGWAACYSSRSSKFLECEAEEYHPCDDDFIVRSITMNDDIYLKPECNDASQQIMQDVFSFPMDDFEAADEPLILHEPDKLYGHDSDGNLYLAVVTNFHNEIGVRYTWFVNDNAYINGSSHCVIRVTSPGVYRCEIQYGDVKLTTNSVEVFKKECSRYELIS